MSVFGAANNRFRGLTKFLFTIILPLRPVKILCHKLVLNFVRTESDKLTIKGQAW